MKYASGRGVQRRRAVRGLRIAALVVGGLVGLFLLANLGVGLAFRGRPLPNAQAAALPAAITLQYGDKKLEVATEQAGISVDEAATQARLQEQRSWLPLVDLLFERRMPAVLAINEQTFTETLRSTIEPIFLKPALGERVVLSGDKFAIAAPEKGYQLDAAQFRQQFVDTLARGGTQLPVPVTETVGDAAGANLEQELAKLNKQLQTKITFSVAGLAKQPGPADIGGWFTPSGQTMVFAPDKVRAYIASLAPQAANTDGAAAAAGYALDTGREITYVLAVNPTAKHTYCVSGKAVGEGHIPGFAAKVAAVLGDPRGWGKGGKVVFEHVQSGCDFSLWLSAPSQMTSFGGLCDSYYSCRSGRNVVINFDRWQGATDPWNAAGGSLDNYRAMVTNHEVGHWLGFGHGTCPGPGQPAPVMQQQSISLQGCTFNPWPTAAELAR